MEIKAAAHREQSVKSVFQNPDKSGKIRNMKVLNITKRHAKKCNYF